MVDYASSDDTSSIMKFFEYLGRPAEAAFTGAKYLIDPDKSALEGMWRGFTGQEKTELSDIMGYDPNTWGGWSADLAAKMIGDPLNLLALGPAQKLLRMGVGKAGDAFLGSRLGPYFGHKISPYSPLAGAEEDLVKNISKYRTPLMENPERVNAYHHAVNQVAETAGKTPEELNAALLKFYEEGMKGATETPGALDVYKQMRGTTENIMDMQAQDYLRAGKQPPGRIMPQINPVTGETDFLYAPREPSQTGRELMTTGEQRPPFLPRAQGVAESDMLDIRSQKSRMIHKVIDHDIYHETGDMVSPVAKYDTQEGIIQGVTKPDVFTKMDAKSLDKAGITKRVVDATDEWGNPVGGKETQYFMGDRRVDLVYTSLSNMQETMPNLTKLFIHDPAVAEYKHALTQANKGTWVGWIGDQVEQGRLITDPAIAAEKGFTQVVVPGFEHLWGHPALVNRANTLGKANFDPETWLGGIDAAMQYFVNNTKFGTLLRDWTGFWSRNTLALFPGFHVGNEISNLFLVFAAGHNPMTVTKDGVNLLWHRAGDVEGLPLSKLEVAASTRGVMEGSLSKDFLRDTEAQIGEIKNKYTHAFTGKLPESLQPGGRAIEKFALAAGELNTAGLKVGQRIEDVSRAGMFVDSVRMALRAEPGALHDEVALGKIFDKAAVHAADALVDYGDLTSLERSLKTTVPFISWYRGLLGRTLEDLGVRPQRIERMGHLLDFTFNPMTQYQQNIAPEYVKDQAPITGLKAFGLNMPLNELMGMITGNDQGAPGMFLGGRFIPYQMIEGLLRRPGSTLGGFINPALKVIPETLLNYDVNKGQNIDLLAQSPGQALTAPITGAPYSYASNREAGVAMPAGYQHVAASMPGWRYVTGYADPIARMLDVAAGGGTALGDPGRLPTTIPEQIANIATGSRVYPFDEARYTKQAVGRFERQVNELRRDIKYWNERGDTEKAASSLQMLEHMLQTTGPLGENK